MIAFPHHKPQKARSVHVSEHSTSHAVRVTTMGGFKFWVGFAVGAGVGCKCQCWRWCSRIDK